MKLSLKSKALLVLLLLGLSMMVPVAFADDDLGGPFVTAPGQHRYLGDVVISYPRAEAQAREAGHPVATEMQLLVVHGVLHLLGYDDLAPDERVVMWAKQAEILREIGITIDLSP